MKSFIALVAALSLTGCVTYRISPKDKPLHADAPTPLRVVKENQSPEGFQCFEPMLWFITVGIIPFQCVDTYNVTLVTSMEPAPEAKYKVTSIGGWAALFIAPLPSWHFGKPENVETQIESVVRRTPK
jgi:hypothetical protein